MKTKRTSRLAVWTTVLSAWSQLAQGASIELGENQALELRGPALSAAQHLIHVEETGQLLFHVRDVTHPVHQLDVRMLVSSEDTPCTGRLQGGESRCGRLSVQLLEQNHREAIPLRSIQRAEIELSHFDSEDYSLDCGQHDDNKLSLAVDKPRQALRVDCQVRYNQDPQVSWQQSQVLAEGLRLELQDRRILDLNIDVQAQAYPVKKQASVTRRLELELDAAAVSWIQREREHLHDALDSFKLEAYSSRLQVAPFVSEESRKILVDLCSVPEQLLQLNLKSIEKFCSYLANRGADHVAFENQNPLVLKRELQSTWLLQIWNRLVSFDSEREAFYLKPVSAPVENFYRTWGSYFEKPEISYIEDQKWLEISAPLNIVVQ